MTNFGFRKLYQDKKTKARAGIIHTPHGDIATPAFVPVGTQASVKSLTPEELNTLGVQLYFVNTYHMYLRPGIDIVKKSGGLHKFMHWDKPLMTDSGGFQVYSLGRKMSPGRRAFSSSATCARSEAGPAARFPPRTPDKRGPRFSGGPPARVTRNTSIFGGDAETRMPTSGDKDMENPQLVKITDDGVEFRSHWDGSKHLFTPESSMQWQWELGADIHIAFDDCTTYPVTVDNARTSMERTHRWAVRSLQAHNKLKIENYKFKIASQSLYGSIQGSVSKELRQESARYISSLNFDGLAIGGVAVGESKKEMRNVLDWVIPLLPEEMPRHLLGVGEIDDIFSLVEKGVDTFDCVGPTRMARTGMLLIAKDSSKKHRMDITKACYARDMHPIENDCMCYTCRNFTRAYIHHLFHVRELLAYRLATIHNIFCIEQLVSFIRHSIRDNSFVELRDQWL
jgi:queuine tRNA-ribosyltransferase